MRTVEGSRITKWTAAATAARAIIATLAGSALPACSPYDLSGEFYAGPVDPKDFPQAYRGDGASPTQFGTIAPLSAVVRGQAVGYFAFPVPASVNPLAARAPNAFVFDPGAQSPFPAPAKCQAPAGYKFDQRTESIRRDEQGNIFPRLPTRTIDMVNVTPTTSYVSLVAEVAVTSKSEPCQDAKSASSVVARPDVTVDVTSPPKSVPNAVATGKPDGKFLAWAIIDPAADVRFPGDMLDPTTHLGPQRWGWFDHFLVAYIDGGYVPTDTTKMPAVLVAQNIYVPSVVLVMGKQVPNDDIGTPSDVLQFKRGEPGYSPLCHVMIYPPPDPADPTKNPTDAAMIAMATEGRYVYCLQPEKQAP